MTRRLTPLLILSLSACAAGLPDPALTGVSGRVFDAEARRTLRAGVILNARIGGSCTLSVLFDDGPERFDLDLGRLLYVRGDGQEISLAGGMYGRVVLEIRPRAGSHDRMLADLTAASRRCGSALRD